MPVGEGDDLVHLGGGEGHTGGVVRVSHQDERRSGRERRRQFIQVGAPPVRLAEMEGQEPAAGVPNEARHLHVVGQHDRRAPAAAPEFPEGHVVRFGPADGHDHRAVRGAGVERCDQRPELVRAVGLTVPEPYRREVRGLAREGDELAHREGVDAALGQVVPDAMLVGRLPPLHLKGDESHRSTSFGNPQG